MRAALEAYYQAWYVDLGKNELGVAAAAERQLRVLIGKATQPGTAPKPESVSPKAPKKRRRKSYPPVPADLIARLTALGGALLSTEPSDWGSYEVLTPLGDPEKRVWMTPGALAAQIEAWEAAGIRGERIAAWMGRAQP